MANGIRISDKPDLPGFDRLFGTYQGTAGNVPVEILAQGVSAASAFPTPHFSVASQPDQTSAAIEATLAARGTVTIPPGEHVLARSVKVGQNQSLSLAPGARLIRKDGMFDTMLRNAQADAFCFGSSHPGGSHPGMARNPWWTDAAGNHQAWEWSDGTVRGETLGVWLDSTYHYDGVSAGRVVVGDIVTIGGLRWVVLASDNTRSPVVNRNGVRFWPDMDRNIGIDCAPGSWFDGNGPHNFSGAEIDWQRWRRLSVLMHGVENLRVFGADIRNSANWSWRNDLVRNVRFDQLYFEQPSYAEGANPDLGIEGIGNLDGLDFGPGCDLVRVNGLSGTTNDDCMALLAFYPKDPGPSYGHNDPDYLWPARMGILNPRYALQDSDYDIRRIAVSSITARPRGSHHIMRAVCADGRRIEDIQISFAADQTGKTEIGGNKYSREHHVALARIGERKYGRVPAGPGDMRNITINAAGYTAREALSFGWSARNVALNGVTLNYTDNVGSAFDDDEVLDDESSPRRQSLVVCHPGNNPFEARWHDGDGATTVFEAPRGRRDYGRDVNAIYNGGALIEGTWDGRVITLPLPGHDYGFSFRGVVTILDAFGDPIPGVSTYAETIRVLKDETGRPTGDLGLVLERTTSPYYDLNAIPEAVTVHILDNGHSNSMFTHFQRISPLAGNGTLKVWLDGVPQEAGTDYTETPGISPANTQEITFAVAPANGAVIRMERFEFPDEHQMEVDFTVRGMKSAGDKPSLNPDPARRSLEWGIMLDQRGYSTIRATLEQMDIAFCQHVTTHGKQSRFDVTIRDCTIHETGQMPFRVQAESLWQESRLTLHNIRTPDRTKIWQFYSDAHGPLPGLTGLVYSGRFVARMTGDMPMVRAATEDWSADIFPIWARDGSELDFDAGAFPGLPFGVRARKFGDYESAGNPGRWVALRTLDGIDLSERIMPCSMGGSGTDVAGPLYVTSGKQFDDENTPPHGYRIRIVPPVANSGALSVVVDGMTGTSGRVATLRPPVDALIPGYLRAGYETVLEWDANHPTSPRWVLHRQIEVGRNANGSYMLHPNMELICQNRDTLSAPTNIAAGPLYEGFATWTYPMAFSGSPVVTTANRSAAARWCASASSVGATSATLRQVGVSNSDTPTAIIAVANGNKQGSS